MGSFVASIGSGMVYTEMGTFFGRFCREWHCYGRPLRLHMHAQHSELHLISYNKGIDQGLPESCPL